MKEEVMYHTQNETKVITECIAFGEGKFNEWQIGYEDLSGIISVYIKKNDL